MECCYTKALSTHSNTAEPFGQSSSFQSHEPHSPASSGRAPQQSVHGLAVANEAESRTNAQTEPVPPTCPEQLTGRW